MTRCWLVVGSILAAATAAPAQETVHVGFLWHMHQPIYIPGENVRQTDASGRFSFSVEGVHDLRVGPYTSWPKNAIQNGSVLPHLGAQVSFSGSLIENLNTLEAGGNGNWNNWRQSYRDAVRLDTALGNPRMDLVGFGYHHPLMPLLDTRDMRMQIQLHKHTHEQTWGPGVPYSKGFFPAETAFSARMIPALVAEGVEWTIFDSIHLERAVENYPHTDASNIYRPNRADQINPAIPAEQWVQLNNLWAPSRVAAPFAYRPHKTQYIDPVTGESTQITAVPAARYEGNEDGRGGFGALQYESVMSQYRHLNMDPDHPMFVLLHHDGDNFGGGSEGYYGGNFNNMINWAQNTSDYDVTTVQDYLDRFPVDPSLVHIESGSWAGADAGDPEYKRWLGDPNPQTGWSPDRNSWAVLTAAKNYVYTAHDVQVGADAFPDAGRVIAGQGSETERGWHYLLQAQASDHWYWDGTEVWDSNVTRGSNLAIAEVQSVVGANLVNEATAPTVFLPQREAYNPGGDEWGTVQPSDFEVWTYAYDVSGLSSVQLKYRLDADGVNPLSSSQNETYAGGAEVGEWLTVDMSSSDIAPPAGIETPTARALRYGAMIEGVTDALVDYYVEAIDQNGNVQRTDIQHVYVGDGVGSGGPGGGGVGSVVLTPEAPAAGDAVSFTYDAAGGPLSGAQQVYAYVGFNDWSTVLPNDPAMTWDPTEELWSLSLTLPSDASQLDLVFNNGADVWDNNGGADWHFAVTGAEAPVQFVIDGVLDAGAEVAASEGGRTLWYALQGTTLYLATEVATAGDDVFVYVAGEPGDPVAANWAKSGTIAAWDAFVADEADNGYTGWFDADGAAETATGAVLEATIDLAAELGLAPGDALPEAIYLALAEFATADGGALSWLLGEQSANGSIDADEYLRLALGEPPLAGDYNGDGLVNAADYTVWRDAYGSTTEMAADGDNSGRIDDGDYGVWRDAYGERRSAPQAVPEPATGATLLTLATLLLVRRRVNG